ncbi:MAG: DUF1330 domain-containing protein [Actinomycetota bacterium]
MPAYLIAHYNVENPDLYREYQKGAGPALKIGSESKLIVLDSASNQVEGEPAGVQTVVLEFESMEKAKEIYESGEYQDVIGKRLDATSAHYAVLVEGFVPPGS